MIILSTGSLYNCGVSRVFEWAATAGFDGIEILIDHRPDTYQVDYLRGLSEAHALPIVALHAPFGYIDSWPQGPLNYLRQSVEIAKALAVPLVVQHLPFRLGDVVVQWKGFANGRIRVYLPWPRRGPFYQFVVGGGLEAMEAESGVTIAIENMPRRDLLGVSVPLYWFNHPDQLLRFRHLTLDTTHVGTWRWDLLAMYEQLKGHVAHVHLSNYDGREHRLPSDGQLPLDKLLRRLGQAGFSGAISVECGPQALEAHDTSRCVGLLRQELAFCRQHLAAG
jgi:sugar phosphate isomerase/epimerase